MKKHLLLLLFAAIGTVAFAQVVNPGGGPVDYSKHMLYVGVKGGVNLSSMSQPDQCDLYDGMGLGYHGGVAFLARFGKATDYSAPGTGLLGVGVEAKYKLQSVKTAAVDESGKANANLGVTYLDVPVYAQIYPFYKSGTMSNLYIEVGPDFGFVLGRSPKTLTYNNLGNDVTFHIDNNESKLKGMDIRVMAGLGYNFPIKNEDQEAKQLIGINARYYMGFNKLAGNFNSKMSNIEISVSWMFNVGKL